MGAGQYDSYAEARANAPTVLLEELQEMREGFREQSLVHMEDGDTITAFDEAALLVTDAIMAAIGRMAGETITPPWLDQLGDGPLGLAYAIVNMVQLVLTDPLDQIPTVDTGFDH